MPPCHYACSIAGELTGLVGVCCPRNGMGVPLARFYSGEKKLEKQLILRGVPKVPFELCGVGIFIPKKNKALDWI